MLSAIMSSFLLFMPGFITSEYLSYLTHKKREFNYSVVANSLIFSFVILGLNVSFKFLKGGASETFNITDFPLNTSFLVKYIGLSTVFALLLPHVILMADTLWKSRKNRTHE